MTAENKPFSFVTYTNEIGPDQVKMLRKHERNMNRIVEQSKVRLAIGQGKQRTHFKQELHKIRVMIERVNKL